MPLQEKDVRSCHSTRFKTFARLAENTNESKKKKNNNNNNNSNNNKNKQTKNKQTKNPQKSDRFGYECGNCRKYIYK